MTNCNTRACALAFFVVLGLFSAMASAEAPTMPSTADVAKNPGAPNISKNPVPPGPHPCKADADKLCKNIQVGKGMGHCLEENMDKLSPACKEKMNTDHPCLKDRLSLCGTAKTPQETRECMMKNKDKLSDACKARMSRVPNKKMGP
jgi:hypothetical protein